MKRLLHVFVVAMACLLAACGSDDDSSGVTTNQTVSITTSVSVSSGAEDASQKAIQTAISDISKVVIEAVAVDDSSVKFTLDLTENAGIYSGSFELIKNRVYQFTASAYIGEVVAYTGSTQQAAAQDASIQIVLNHVDSGSNTSIPQINKIQRPASIEPETTVNMSFSVTGNAGETLSYTLLGDTGSFTPSSGTIALSIFAKSTVVVAYQAPATMVSTTIPYTLKLTNEDGNSVSTSFSLVTDPADVATGVNVKFNPAVLGITGQRNGSTVTWQADVDSVGDAAFLEYQWGFTATSGVAQFAVNSLNPASMDAYEETVAGTIDLQVTDTSPSGGVTNYSYELVAGQFPDVLVADIPDACTNLEGNTYINTVTASQDLLIARFEDSTVDPSIIAMIDYTQVSPQTVSTLSFAAGKISIQHAGPVTSQLQLSRTVIVGGISSGSVTATGDANLSLPLIVGDYSCSNNTVNFDIAGDAVINTAIWTDIVATGLSELLITDSDSLNAQFFADSKLHFTTSGNAFYKSENDTLTLGDKVFSVQ